MTKRVVYTREFKMAILAQIEAGDSIAQAVAVGILQFPIRSVPYLGQVK